MPKQSLLTLKNWFKRGLKPLESQFSDWLDSFWHKDANDIPITSIQNLQNILNDLATISAVTLKEDKASKGIANGYASLDGNIRVPVGQLQNAIDLLRGSVPSAGDTLNKLYVLIQNVTGVSPPEAFSAAGGVFPTTYGGLAIKAGSSYRITAAGTLGSSNQKTVNNEDLIIALVNNPTNNGNDWQAIESNRELATSAVLGLVRLYTDLSASNIDGTVTQAALVTALGLKANLASPAFTGTPTAPTASPGTNTTQLATTAFVRAADDLKLNKGANPEYESLSDATDVYQISMLTRLGAVYRSTFVKWNETLKQFRVEGTQAIWSAVAGVTDGNMGIKTLEGVIESFKLFDNSGNFLTTGVDSGKRLIRHFTAVRLFSGIYFTETELNSIAAVGSATTLIKPISTTANTIIVVSVDNICVQNIDKNYIIGRAQFSFKNDGGTLTQISQNFLRYDHQYSTIKGSPGVVTNTDTRVDASISGTTININIVVTENKLTNIICETKYCITQLPS